MKLANNTKFLRSLPIVLSILIGTAQFASASDFCQFPDKTFDSFLDRFKNDNEFQKTRIIYPLQVASTEPGINGEMTEAIKSLSLKEIQDKSMTIIIGKTRASELMGGEGKLCEAQPEVKGDRATFLQWSCHTDVYGYKFDFLLKNNCWFLERLTTSGG